MSSKPPNKVIGILKVALGVFVGFVQLNTDHHGLVSPTNAEAIGADIWGAAVYLFCIWAIVTGVRTLMPNETTPVLSQAEKSRKERHVVLKSQSPELVRTDIPPYARTENTFIRPIQPDYKPRADASSTLPASPTSADAPSGVGGWLLLLIIRLWIGTGIRVFGGLAAGLSLLGIFSLGSAALSGLAAYLLGRKSAKGVMVAKVYLVADGLYYILALLDWMLGGAAQLSGDLPPWFKPSGYLVACVLWLVYLAHSERVRNTYFPAEAEDERNRPGELAGLRWPGQLHCKMLNINRFQGIRRRVGTNLADGGASRPSEPNHAYLFRV